MQLLFFLFNRYIFRPFSGNYNGELMALGGGIKQRKIKRNKFENNGTAAACTFRLNETKKNGSFNLVLDSRFEYCGSVSEEGRGHSDLLHTEAIIT